MWYIYYIKVWYIEYVPQCGTKVWYKCFYLILSNQLYRFGARQPEITLAEFCFLFKYIFMHLLLYSKCTYFCMFNDFIFKYSCTTLLYHTVVHIHCTTFLYSKCTTLLANVLHFLFNVPHFYMFNVLPPFNYLIYFP